MFILASKSPRRQELIKKLVSDFDIIVPNIDESSVKTTIECTPLEISKLKAYKIYSNHPDDEVLACDTVVVINNTILGKPKDKEDAKRMLKILSGKKHIVLSGYTYISKNKEVNRTVKSFVYFNELSDELIDAYIKTGSPMDKAGSYGIQDKDKGFNLIKKIEGSYDNVMGLPTEDIARFVINKTI